MSDNAHTRHVPSEANSRIVSGFLDYLKIEKGLASLTVSGLHHGHRPILCVSGKAKTDIAQRPAKHVRDFIQQLFANSVDGRSVGRKLSALRHLYRYLLLDKIVEHDPTLNIDSPKQWKVLPKALARDEMESILGMSHSTAGGKDGRSHQSA